MCSEPGPFSCGRGPEDCSTQVLLLALVLPWHAQLCLFCQIVSFSQAIYTQPSKPNIIKPSSVCMILLEVSIIYF